MLASQQPSASSDGANSQNPVQTESERQWPRDFDPLFDDMAADGLGGAGPPDHLHGGFSMSDFNHGWPLASDMAAQPAYNSPEVNFGGAQPPSMNQGFNALNSPHTAAQQSQWNPGNHFDPSNPSLFDPIVFPNAANLVGLGQQNQFSGATVNNQRSVPPSRTQVVGGGHQQAAARGASTGVQSPQVDRQATRNPSAITSHPRPDTVVNGTRTSPTNNQATQARHPIPAPAPELNLGQDEGNLRMPDWLALVKPSPMNVITLRRETHVALDILLERLPRQPPGGYSGIKIPATASVRNFAETNGKPLEFRIYVTGATSNRRYETVCQSCEKREGKKKGTPSFIDFYAVSDVVEQKDGKARVEFVFCCYPKCHGDSGYFLDVVLSEDANQTNVVAQYRLPFSFRVVAKLPQGRKRPRGQMEQPEEPPNVDQRNVRARFDDPMQRDADDERNDHPMPAVNPRNAGQYREGDSSSASPPAVSPPQPRWNAGPIPGPITPSKAPNPAIAPPSTDGESGPTLTEVNPESGSITGGARIWLKGIDFPALFPLFARFGITVVPTTFSASNLLACNLPPANHPGLVNVTLSKHPQPNAPQYGTSIANFQYIGDHDQLIPILLRIQGQGYPEFSPVLQALLTSLNGPQPNRGLHGGSHGAGPRDDPIETGLMEALSCLQARSNFHEIVSTTNDYHQTLAHLAILYDYPSLLGRLVEWRVDLTIADVNGLTALHCAYMKGDLDVVRILRRGGASESAKDKLGRTPSELQPEGLEGFDSDIDLDAELAAGLDADVYLEADDIDEQLALGEQFSALDLEDDNDSGHGQSDSDDDASEDEEENPDNMAIDSHPGGNEGDGGGVASGSGVMAGGSSGGVASGSGGGQIASGSKEPAIHIMNQLLLEKNRRKKKKNRGARMLPDTPYDPAISTVSKKLREAEAEAEALDFLTSGIFPDGAISLVSLKTEMTQEEVDEFQVLPHTMKYHGLLRRDREIFYCRLCPEDNQLDFKDHEEALHHMTKDHLDMGYSCDCGCNETYWTSADWRRHRKRKGLSLIQGEEQMQAVVAT